MRRWVKVVGSLGHVPFRERDHPIQFLKDMEGCVPASKANGTRPRYPLIYVNRLIATPRISPIENMNDTIDDPP